MPLKRAPAGQSAEKATGLAVSMADGTPAHRSNSTPADKPVKKRGRPPGTTTADKPVRKRARKPVNAPAEKRAEKVTDKPLGLLDSEPIDHPINQPAKTSTNMAILDPAPEKAQVTLPALVPAVPSKPSAAATDNASGTIVVSSYSSPQVPQRKAPVTAALKLLRTAAGPSHASQAPHQGASATATAKPSDSVVIPSDYVLIPPALRVALAAGTAVHYLQKAAQSRASTIARSLDPFAVATDEAPYRYVDPRFLTFPPPSPQIPSATAAVIPSPQTLPRSFPPAPVNTAPRHPPQVPILNPPPSTRTVSATAAIRFTTLPAGIRQRIINGTLPWTAALNDPSPYRRAVPGDRMLSGFLSCVDEIVEVLRENGVAWYGIDPWMFRKEGTRRERAMVVIWVDMRSVEPALRVCEGLLRGMVVERIQEDCEVVIVTNDRWRSRYGRDCSTPGWG